MDYIKKLRLMEEQIINSLYIAMVILFLPMIYTISKRVAVVGLDSSSIATFVLMSVAILLYVFKKRIPLVVRTGYIVLAFYINGVSMMLAFGLLGLGLLNFLQSVIIASLFLKKKYYIIDFCLVIVTAFTFMFLYLEGTLTYSFDVNDYIKSSNAWIAQVVGFLAALGLNSVPIHIMTNILKNTTKEVVTNEDKIKALLESENLRLENEIAKRTAELEETYNELINQEKMASLGRLVSGVAHEINTPLGVSVTAVTYLQDLNNETFEGLQTGGFTKQKLIDYMKHVDESTEIIKNNLERSSELVKNFKKISVNQVSEFKTKFNVKEYIEQVFMTLRHEYKNKNIDISIQGDEEIVIKSYPGMFSQVFTNLLMNSLIHGFEGRDKGKITLKIRKEDSRLWIDYMDDGVGISEEQGNMIFEPFYTTKRSSGGSGLGMHIVYNIVTVNLGGEIKLGKPADGGVSFSIRIPLKGEGHE